MNTDVARVARAHAERAAALGGSRATGKEIRLIA